MGSEMCIRDRDSSSNSRNNNNSSSSADRVRNSPPSPDLIDLSVSPVGTTTTTATSDQASSSSSSAAASSSDSTTTASQQQQQQQQQQPQQPQQPSWEVYSNWYIARRADMAAIEKVISTRSTTVIYNTLFLFYLFQLTHPYKHIILNPLHHQPS